MFNKIENPRQLDETGLRYAVDVKADPGDSISYEYFLIEGHPDGLNNTILERLKAGEFGVISPPSGFYFSGENKLVATPEYAAIKAGEAEKAMRLTGIEFDGVMCSATGDDQNGLLAVFFDYKTNPGAFEATKFTFSNGNVLLITSDNIDAFYETWKPFRRQFFKKG